MLIPLLVFGVLLIALIFFLVKSASTWNWLQITLVAVIFLTAIFGGISATRSMKTRSAWMKRYNDNEARHEIVKAEFDEALYGSPDTVVGYGEGSLRDINTKLSLSEIGKGRVWRNGQPSRAGEQYKLTFAAPADGTAPSTQITQDMQLFAFEDGVAEVNIPGIEGVAEPSVETIAVPAQYIGSFKIAATNPGENSVTLEPLFVNKSYRIGSLMRMLASELTGADADKIRLLARDLEMELSGDNLTEYRSIWEPVANGGGADGLTTWLNQEAVKYEPTTSNWSLFEKMPGDNRNVFKEHMGFPVLSETEPMTPELLAQYRDALRETYLPAEMLGMDPESVEYEELLDQYTFDGVKLNEINQYIGQNSGSRINDRFDPPIENIWGNVKYLSKSEDYLVDAEGNPVTDGPFNFTGQANLSSLKFGGPISISKDVEIRVPRQVGKDGYPFGINDRQPPIVELEEAEWTGVEYYQRPNRDYPYLLQQLRDFNRELAEQQQSMVADIGLTGTREQADVGTILGDADRQIGHRNDMEVKLRADIARVERDLDEIRRLSVLREAQLMGEREAIRTYYNQIIELYKDMQESLEYLDTGNRTIDNSVADGTR